MSSLSGIMEWQPAFMRLVYEQVLIVGIGRLPGYLVVHQDGVESFGIGLNIWKLLESQAFFIGASDGV